MIAPIKVIKKIVTIIAKVNSNIAIEKRIAINEKILKSIAPPHSARVTPTITKKTIGIISLPQK